MSVGTIPLIRPLHFHEISHALGLLGSTYGLPSGETYGRDYPYVFGEGGDGVIWGAFEGEDILSVAAALPGALVYQEQGLPFARVGSVATASKARGLGLAGQVLESLHGALGEKGQAIAGLWASRGGIYARMGYVPVGAAYIAKGGLRAPAPFRAGLRISLAEAPIPPWLAPLDHDFGPELLRGSGELEAILGISPMTVALGTRGEAVVSWACLGRGLDMGGIIHDFGGPLEDVLPLIQRLFALGATGVLCPAHHPIRLYLSPDGELGPVLWMTCLNRSAVLGWAQGLGIAQGLEDLEDGLLLQHLFGPPARVGRPCPPPGRLPFFIWGLDSI